MVSFNFGFISFILLAITSEQVFGRHLVLERDGKPVFLVRRRFGAQNPAVANEIGAACPGQVCGILGGKVPSTLLGAAPECAQQDLADDIIDASKQFDAATQANMVRLAQAFRQTEKNTPPDFSSTPPKNRNSVFCQKAPRNPELIGLVQAQDPANDPTLFFDPALGKTVIKGSQPNTEPFGGVAAAPPAVANPVASEAPPAATATGCAAEVTVTVTADAAATPISGAVTVTAGEPQATSAPVVVNPPAAGIDFGSCTPPQIEFGQGFDNRKETAFRPVDQQNFKKESAQNIDIITQFMCDQLTNTCKANQAAKDLCQQARAAASAATKGSGAQADAFNAIFGIITTFVNSPVISNQGITISPGSGSAQATTVSQALPVVTGQPTPTALPQAGTNPGTGSTGSTSDIGNFGSCSIPQIEFAQGLEGRRETAFQPVDKVNFNHGSAQNIDIITRFVCDQLVNRCGADATARATCATAQAAASAATAKTGAQADAFNAVFGRTTNFKAVQPFDDQGRPVGAAGQGTVAPAPATAAPQAGGQTGQTSGQTGGQTGAQTGNLQTFSGALGGVVAPTVISLGGGRFQVTGNAAFNNLRNAVVRSCDVQNNQCANAANASGNKDNLTVQACAAQQTECISAAPKN